MPKITEGIVTLGGLFALAVWFLVGLPLYYGPPHSGEQQHVAGEHPAHSTNAKPDGSAAAPFVVQVISSPKSAEERVQEAEEREEKKSADRWLVRWTAALFAATVGLILATGVLGYFGLQQSRDMKTSIDAANRSAASAAHAAEAAHDSNKIAKETSEQELRAYVLPVKVVATVMTVGLIPKIEIELRNSGQTPAYRVATSAKIGIRDINAAEFELEWSDRMSRATIAPNMTFYAISPGFTRPLTQKSVDAIKEGRAIFCVNGEVRYVDAFGNNRTTRFKYIFDEMWVPCADRLRAAADGNYAD